MKEISSKDFSVFFGDDVFEDMAQKIIENEYSKVFVLVDENTEHDCYPILKNYLVNVIVIRIESGEQNKTLKTVEYIWKQLQDNFADRKALFINLGGGVISDLGGFCAATYKRGIDFINVPTTLLAMVDASIGGKQGFDIDSHKNMVGVFAHPKNIYMYPKFLETLPLNEKKCGVAELSKHALIKNKSLWEEMLGKSILDDKSINELIQKSAKIKIKIVKKDPLEKGLRKILNFGHSIGHAIETWSLKNDTNPLKHGEAVAIGMLCEAYISHKLLGLTNEELHQIVAFVEKNYTYYDSQWDEKELIVFMHNDKKNLNGKFNLTLLKKIGKAKIDMDCSSELISESLSFYQNLKHNFPTQHSA